MNILILANCEDYEYTGSGYAIKNSRLQLEKHAKVVYYDIRDYTILKFLKNRAIIYRAFIGKALFILKLILKGHRYEVIEFWGGDSGLAMLVTKTWLPKTLIIHRTNGIETKYHPIIKALDSNKKWYHLNMMPIFELSFKLADGIITTTEQDAKWAKQQYPNAKTRTVPYGLLPTYLNLPLTKHKNYTIGYTGTWLRKKGIDIIKADLPNILRKFPLYKLILIGVGKNFSKQNNFPEDVHNQITVIPFITDKVELMAAYKMLDIFILPSFAESFGLVLAEAMANSCCTIATKTGFSADLEHKKEVYHIDNYKPNSLYNALHELITDELLAHHIALNGYKRVQSLTWEANGLKSYDTYKEWLHEKKSHTV